MRRNGRAATWARGQLLGFLVVMRPSLVTARIRMPSLWNCHDLSSNQLNCYGPNDSIAAKISRFDVCIEERRKIKGEPSTVKSKRAASGNGSGKATNENRAGLPLGGIA